MLEAGLVRFEARRPLPGREQGAQGGRRGGVLDDAGKAGRKPDHLPEPVEDDLLELGRRRGGLPDHALGAEAGRQKLPQDRGRAVVGREVGEPARVLPVGDARHDDLLEILEDRLHGLPPGRGDGRDHLLDVARLEPGDDGVFLDIFEIIGDPVHELVPGAPEILVFHGNLLGPGPFCPSEGRSQYTFFQGKPPGKRLSEAISCKAVKIGSFSGLKAGTET